ncbi:MAG: Gfo/Idh/MocA family oxidoreductase [Candidatus Aminicenantes bacterium]|nr:Gfo/Idh/MocA family oxidoreductase [Candidatus Aminicenantes bacterium]
MSQNSYSVAIIGAGLIGKKRAAALNSTKSCRLLVTIDVDKSASESVAKEFGGETESDWLKVVNRKEIDIVTVATINKFLAPICISSLRNGKHVLCEKPLGRNTRESEKIIEAATNSKVILKTGFNHRHHPAIFKAKKLVESGAIGNIYYIRCVYGHGGRPGYEKEWRSSKDLCGGGELLDQGVHVVDLFRWFLGELEEVYGKINTFYWNMKVEDNAFAMFKTKKGQVALMHTSWTQWKNKFLFEVFGEKGYLIVDGLGGSYGTEKLIIGKRKYKNHEQFLGGPPDEEIIEFPGPDISWTEEWKELVSAINENREPLGSGNDGLMANKLIEAVYQSAKLNKPVKIKQIN